MLWSATHFTRKAVKACVEPTLLYGAEAWYPGPNINGKPTRIQHLIKRMHTPYAASLRAAVPVWKTTPLDLLLESHKRRFAARLQTLDHAHPLTNRSSRSNDPRLTRLQRTALLLPQAPRPILLPRAPPASLQTPSKEQATAEFQDWLDFLPKRDVVVFSEGSMTSKGVGFGYVIWRGGRVIGCGCGGLRSAEVFDAEVKGALEGLKKALAATTHRVPIHVCINNTSVILSLRGQPSESSQDVFLEFQRLAKEHGEAKTAWCPGPMNILGNELADAHAKRGCKQQPLNSPPTLAYIRRTSRAKARQDFAQWWNENMPETYQPLGLKAELRCPAELLLARPILHQLLAARTQHGDFAASHERFRHEDAELKCSCGCCKNPFHPFYCRKVRPSQRLRLTPTLLQAIHRALGTKFQSFATLIEASQFHTLICPRH